MKQKDIALILVIVFVSGILSFFISNKFISPPKHDLEAAKVEPITYEFHEPSTKYFNDKSINPTQLIRINNNSNENPFNGR
jgi:hypothetical protein